VFQRLYEKVYWLSDHPGKPILYLPQNGPQPTDKQESSTN